MAGVTKSDLGQLEVVLDRLFAKSGIDIEFTKHFFDRVNDARNKKPITVEELNKVFTELQSRRKLMNKIKGGGDGFERVLKDATTDINIPFVIKYDSYTRMMELVTKTIMRKKGFKSKDTPFMKISTEGIERTPLVLIGEGKKRRKKQKAKGDDTPLELRKAQAGAAGMAAQTKGRGGPFDRRPSKKKRSKMGARNRDPRKGGYQGEADMSLYDRVLSEADVLTEGAVRDIRDALLRAAESAAKTLHRKVASVVGVEPDSTKWEFMQPGKFGNRYTKGLCSVEIHLSFREQLDPAANNKLKGLVAGGVDSAVFGSDDGRPQVKFYVNLSNATGMVT